MEPDECEVFRPPADDIRTAWHALFSDPLLSLTNLRAAAVAPNGIGHSDPDGGIILRSVYWRFYHGLLPPPTSLNLFPHALANSRRGYNELRKRYLVAPDGRWASDCTGGEGCDHTTTASQSPVGANSGGWDPLSLDGESPWKAWFSQLEMRETIRQDVDRTFPDITYFTLNRVRRALTTMLFIFAILNPDVGYRQGMHELLAVCLLVVDRDSLELQGTATGVDSVMLVTLDRSYIEHDSFSLFQELMRSAKSFYEWRAEEGPRSQIINGPQAPIITRCNHLHSSLIRRIDPQLWERLENEGVEAQIWAIRWIRLILTRELPLSIALRLWDGVFSQDPSLGILDFVCVAMLLLIRNELINADYPALLTQLLHYPAPSSPYPFNPSLILTQAIFLQENISPAAGVEVVIQNQDIFGIKASGPERQSDYDGLPRRKPHDQLPPSRPGSANRKAKVGVQGLAQGLFERAQAAGIDKAIMSTVADFRKNLPDTATAYSYLPNLPFSPGHSPSPRDQAVFSSIPSNQSALPRLTRPILQPQPSADSSRSLLDAERQMAELRLTMVGMGKAMAEWLSVLRNADSDTETQVEASRGIDLIRDSLLDAAGTEVDDLVKQWAWHDGLEAPRSSAMTPAPTATAPHRERIAVRTTEQQSIGNTSSISATPLSSDRPETPTFTIVPASPSINHPVGSALPQRYLSTESDIPTASLSRVAKSSAPKSESTFSSVLGTRSPALSPRPVKDASNVSSQMNQPILQSPYLPINGPMDPLAGIDVGTIERMPSTVRRGFVTSGAGPGTGTGTGSGSGSGNGRSTASVDPLGVIG